MRRARQTVGPDGDVMLDCWMAFTESYAEEPARRLEPYRVYWLEECLMPDNYAGMGRLKANVRSTRMATGEHEYMRYGFKLLADHKAADKWQPDMHWCGGLTELRWIDALACAHRIPLIPHGGWRGSSAHFEFANDNTPWCEMFLPPPGGPNEVYARFEEEHQIARRPGGVYMRPPNRPGFGSNLSRHRTRRRSSCKNGRGIRIMSSTENQAHVTEAGVRRGSLRSACSLWTRLAVMCPIVLLAACAVVVMLTIWLTLPALKESIIARAVENNGDVAWWWLPSWRREYRSRIAEKVQRALVLFESASIEPAGVFVVSRNRATLDLVSPLPSPAEVAEMVRSDDPARLAVIRAAPEFDLVDQTGQSLRAANLKGTVAIVSFIFTTCNGTCPATTHRLVQARQELKARGLLESDRVRFVSITLDPERDTPEVLDRYRRLYDIDASGWSFLTGAPEHVRKVIDAWGMWARPAANGQLDHPSRIFLVDPQGRIREIYNLSFLKPDWMADDVKLLLDEFSSSRGETR